MNYKPNEIKAGLFIFVSIILFFVFLVVIMGRDRWTEKDQYTVQFQYSGGLEQGSMVRYGGFQVGRVKEVFLPGKSSDKISLILELKKNTPIRQASHAYLTTLGIMGAGYVEISPGDPQSPLLPPGSIIKSKDVPGFVQLTEPAGEAMDQTVELLARINDLFNEQNRENISKILNSLNDMTSSNSQQMNELIANMNVLTLKMQQSVDATNTIIANSDTVLHNSLLQMEGAIIQTRDVMDNFNHLLKEIDETTLANRQEFAQIVNNMNDMSQYMAEFSRSMKERPWSLVRKEYPRERKLD